MVEAISASIEDKLIDGLSFKLPATASYVTERKSATFHPAGSNVYEPGTGTRLIKLQLTGDHWMDPSTVRVMFDLTNKDADAAKLLRPLSGPHAFFRRMRVLAGGQVLEDIDNYNRVHEMMHTLTATDSRENDGAEAFGFVKSVQQKKVANAVGGISGGDSITMLFKPLSGILSQGKYLPIRYMPLTLELELVDKTAEPIAVVGGAYTDANTSVTWKLENVQLKCDLCSLDNGLDNSYAEHLLSGKALPINYSTFVSQMQTIANDPKAAVNVSRALTRLKSVFVSMVKARTGNDAVHRREFNDFYSPMSAENKGGTLTHAGEGEIDNFQIQVGSKLFPEYPIRSHAEAFYQLQKTLGVQASTLHNFDINACEYRDSKFILGIDTEKVLEAGYTGLNTRAGDMMRVRLNTKDGGRQGDSMHIVLHSDQIVEVTDSGVTVFD